MNDEVKRVDCWSKETGNMAAWKMWSKKQHEDVIVCRDRQTKKPVIWAKESEVMFDRSRAAYVKLSK